MRQNFDDVPEGPGLVKRGKTEGELKVETAFKRLEQAAEASFQELFASAPALPQEPKEDGVYSQQGLVTGGRGETFQAVVLKQGDLEFFISHVGNSELRIMCRNLGNPPFVRNATIVGKDLKHVKVFSSSSGFWWNELAPDIREREDRLERMTDDSAEQVLRTLLDQLEKIKKELK